MFEARVLTQTLVAQPPLFRRPNLPCPYLSFLFSLPCLPRLGVVGDKSGVNLIFVDLHSLHLFLLQMVTMSP